MRLDRFLATAMPTLSRSRLGALIKSGSVRRDGAVVEDPSARVKRGQCFEVDEPEPQKLALTAEERILDIVFEDADLVVLEKPAGLVVHPAPGHATGTLVHALLAHCAGQLSGIGGVERPGIVHRLDKDVSGVMVVAKTDAAHRGLAGQFAVHSVDRVYEALVHGLPPASMSVDAPIGRHPKDRKRMAVVERGGKRAVTHIERVGVLGPRAARVACTLETGRTHQIRVHLSHSGHGILGDHLYTTKRNVHLPSSVKAMLADWNRIALHARLLGFDHPITGARCTFERPPPAAFATLAERLLDSSEE